MVAFGNTDLNTIAVVILKGGLKIVMKNLMYR